MLATQGGCAHASSMAAANYRHAPTGSPPVVQTPFISRLIVQGPRGTISPAQPNSAVPVPSRISSHSRGHSLPCFATATAPAATVTRRSPAVTPQQVNSSLRGLYPPTTSHKSGYLKVSDLHSIYYEVHGNPAGVPAVVVHGGPGAGCYPNHARFFDPQHYRIILLDQRGCGRSTPSNCLVNNNTTALVSDLDALRRHLGIQQWLMLGGSWGVALTLAYAQQHPADVLGIVLRGVCLMRPSEIQWMYGVGAAALKPLAWERFIGLLEPYERANPVLGYYKRLLSREAAVRQEAAKSWMAWECAVGFSRSPDMLVWEGQQWAAQQAPAAAGQQHELLPPPPAPSTAAALAVAAGIDGCWQLQRGPVVPAAVMAGLSSGSCSNSSNSSSINSNSSSYCIWRGLNHRGCDSSAAQALLECHYSLHGAFLLEYPLLDHINRVRHIPCIAVQGQMDFVCPPITAVELSKAWPEMELRLVPNAGHSMYDPAIMHEVVCATDRMRELEAEQQWQRKSAPVAVAAIAARARRVQRLK